MEKKVLLVADDIEMNRSVIKRFMGKEFEVLEAKNGQEVLDILSENKVDVLLLDIIMPILDGLEILKRIKEKGLYPHMAILVATSTKEKTERQALDYGADDIVAKPYDPTVIYHRMRNILEKYDLQRRLQRLEDRGAMPVQSENISEITALEKGSLLGKIKNIENDLMKGKAHITNTQLLDACLDHAILQLENLKERLAGEHKYGRDTFNR